MGSGFAASTRGGGAGFGRGATTGFTGGGGERRRRKLDRSGRRRRLRPRRRKWLSTGGRDRRARRPAAEAGSGGSGGRRLLDGRRRRLLGDWRGGRGRRRRLGRSRGGALSWRRRGLVGRLRLNSGGRRRFRGRSFRLNVDDHFPRQFDRSRLEIDERKRRRVHCEHDCDDERTKPGRAERRRLECAPVQSCEGHGACALGAAGTGAPGKGRVAAFGAGGVGAARLRGPDTIAMREIPFAASSSITETTSP